MEVTSIKAQQNRPDHFSIFIDGKFVVSLSGGALLEMKIVRGQIIDANRLAELKRRSDEDALSDRTIRFASLRLRSVWEIKSYLQRKDASPALTEHILNKLSNMQLLSDEAFAAAYIRDHQRLRPASRRKIISELRHKHIADDLINRALSSEEQQTDHTALRALIERKRKQSTYKDDLKLMQYLSRQGFNYGDIKDALKHED